LKLFLGVDGGQSSTTALIGDETGQVIGIGRAGPVNHVAAEEARARFLSALSTSIGAAQLAAGVENAQFESACFGFSGGPADKEALAREVVRASHYSITHDALIALEGATAGQGGIVVIAGTGSIAFGRNAEGKTARAGGWGYIFGDEGGAFDLVRQALRLSLQYEEGWGPPTALKDALLKETGAGSANDLLHRFYTPEYPRARVAGLARVVEEASSAGDEPARQLLAVAAHSLGTLASSVRRLLFAEHMPVLVSYVGGVFRNSRVLNRFRLLVELEAGNKLVAPQFGPAAGALLEAYRIAGVKRTLKGAPEEK
jgi:N-acetylglucosamine kinase-like BadF-type ATPase